MKSRRQILIILIPILIFSIFNGFLPSHSHFDHCHDHTHNTESKNNRCQNNDFCLSCLIQAKNINLRQNIDEHDFQISAFFTLFNTNNFIDNSVTDHILYNHQVHYKHEFLNTAFSRRAPPNIIL